MNTFFPEYAMGFQPSIINIGMPINLFRLLKAVRLDRFDLMIGYGYAMSLTSALVQGYCDLQIGNTINTDLCLYFLTIAPSGSGKGCTFKSLYTPVAQLIENRQKHDEAENKRRRAKNAALEGIITEKKKQARKLSGNPLDALQCEIAELEEQKLEMLPEFVFDVQDVTPAALIQLLKEQESHSLLIADTEGRFMRSLDEDKSLSAMLNQTFCGEAISNSRVSVKSLRVENPHVSIAAACQPEKLDRLTKNPNLWGEGFLARVLPYFASPTMNNGMVGEIIDKEIMEWWRMKVESLFAMKIPRDDSGQRYVLRLDMSARQCFEAHAQQLQAMKSSPANIGIQCNLSRLAEITARIAAIYHILAHPSPFEAPISGDMMQFAASACHFFLAQVRKLYGEFNPDPVVKLIPKICCWLKSRGGTTDYVTLKDIYGGIGGQKSGLIRAVQWLWSQRILLPATGIAPIPNFLEQFAFYFL